MLNSCGISVCGETNLGLCRKKNEDNFGVLNLPGRASVLAAVADGIGGHRDGDLASLICCRDLLGQYFALTSDVDTPKRAEAFLAGALKAINGKLHSRNAEVGGDRPMGCTLVAVIFGKEFLTLLNVGDSRFYELRPETGLVQHSVDHTLCNEPEALAKVQARNPNCDLSCVLCRAVGTRPEVEPQLLTLPRHGNSRYLLCSDGAYRDVAPQRISELLSQADSPREAVNGLMRAALLAGGKDNISIVSAFSEKQQEER